MLRFATAWSMTRSRVRRWLHRSAMSTALHARPRRRIPLRLAAYEFFDAVGAFLRRLAASAERHHELTRARAELHRSLDALQRAVAIAPASAVHAYADCATLGEHVIALLAGLEGLVDIAASSATPCTGARAVRPAVLRLARAYERWADALADQGLPPASPRVPWGFIPASPPLVPTELEASQRELVEASSAVMMQLRSLVQAPAHESSIASSRSRVTATSSSSRIDRRGALADASGVRA